MESTIESLPRHFLIDNIMLRMPLKSLLNCNHVCTKFRNIIRDKDFQDRYLIQSMKKPRLLFAFCPHSLHDPRPDVLFHSVYQEENLLLSSDQQQMHITSEERYTMISAPIRGLVCLQSRTKVVLCNPGTKRLLTLPECQPSKPYSARKCFFGYDEVTDVFKVLWSESSETYEGAHMYNQVFTLGPGENSWRPIVCEHRYFPITNGLCIGGVLYYGVWSRHGKWSEIEHIVISFNVRSEDFTVTKLPEGVEVEAKTKLVNYNGKVALVTGSEKDLYDNGEFQICVRDESAGIWRVERIVIPRWRDTVGDMLFGFEGTIGTGELIFAIHSLLDGSHFVLYYDTITQNLRKFKIEGVDGGSYHYARTFLNHVDSLFLT